MRIIYIFSIVCLLQVTTGCRKFVEVGTPYTLNSNTTVFADGSSAGAAVTGIYANMISKYYSYEIARRTGAYADELINYDNSDLSKQMYTDALNPNTYNSLWTDSYSLLYQVNSVIAGLNASTQISSAVKSQLMGETRFSRALLYFYLVNMYGDVPNITGTDYTANAQASRTAAATLYQNMEADCRSADSLLNADYVDATSITTTTERIRPTKWAAEALLARIYLYAGDYKDAEQYSGQVIANTSLFSLDADLNDVFLKNSTESIWQFQKVQQNQFYADGNNWQLQYYVSTYGESNSSSLSAKLMDAFEAGDNRKTDWVNTYTDFSGNLYYYPYKYKEGYVFSPATPGEYTTVLRLAEQYLIRAEARTMLGEMQGAADDLNAVRNRAGLANYAGSMDQGSLVTAILHERQVELFTEWGNRWLDMKRSGSANTIMAAVAPLKGGTWTTDKNLWPIPQSEITNDQKLTQNPGY